MSGPKKICLLGGSGFVGSRVAGMLAARGDDVVIPTRNLGRARDLLVLPNVRLLLTDVNESANLRAALAGCAVAVNLVGILNERGRSGAGFQAAHVGIAAALAGAVTEAEVSKVVQMSALGAGPDAPSHYLRSKGGAERIIAQGGFAWTILRPSVIFGPGDSFTNRFARLLRWLPVFPLAMPGTRFAPVHVDDVATAILRAIDDPATDQCILELCGAEVLTLREIVAQIARALGLRRLILGLPMWLSRLQGRIMDFVPGKPFSTDNFLSLTVDSLCQEDGMAALGLKPRSFAGGLTEALGDIVSRTRLDSARRRARRSAA